MKIAIVKPDYKIYGGFEAVIDRLRDGLQDRGFTVEIVKIDVTSKTFPQQELNIPQEVYNHNRQYFDYMLSFQRFKNLNLKHYDCVVSTQPPSFCVDHHKNLVLFYHHLKIYYELYDLIMEVGLINRKYHRLAMKYVREVDGEYLTHDKYYVAGSEHAAKKLRRYNGITRNLYKFSAGVADELYSYEGPKLFKYPICVGRHEFPKRTELFIQAMKYLDEFEGLVIGEGGQTETLKKIDVLLTFLYRYKGEEVDSSELWKEIFFRVDQYRIGEIRETLNAKSITSNIKFTGEVTIEDLIKHYSQALCVVCPSYEEDYGLTAIEAMAFGKPVIACTDGGGYLELIQDGETGFIVEPSGKAIASAIKRLMEDRDMLSMMSKNAYEFSRKYSWGNSLSQFEKILGSIMEG